MKGELRIKEYPGMKVYLLYVGDFCFASLADNQGVISDVWVDVRYRRKGWATWLWNRAGRPEHSITRTPEGHLWALSTGTPIPEENTYDADWS